MPRKLDHILHTAKEELLAKTGELFATDGYPTGISHLDMALGGLHRGTLTLLASPSGMAATNLALQIARGLSHDQAASVLYVSLQESSGVLIGRLLAQESGVERHRIRTGFLTPGDEAKILDALEQLRKDWLYIEDFPGLTLTELRSIIREHEFCGELALIVLDSLDDMGTVDMPPCDRSLLNQHLARGLRALAYELDVPILALLDLPARSGMDQRQTLNDLASLGRPDLASDVVLFLHREEYFRPRWSNSGVAEVSVARNRMGFRGTVNLDYDRHTGRFRDPSEPDEVELPRSWCDPDFMEEDSARSPWAVSNVKELGTCPSGSEVRLAGTLHAVKILETKSGTMMAIAQLQDAAGDEVTVVAYPSIYGPNAELFTERMVLDVTGKYSRIDDRRQIAIHQVSPVEPICSQDEKAP